MYIIHAGCIDPELKNKVSENIKVLEGMVCNMFLCFYAFMAGKLL